MRWLAFVLCWGRVIANAEEQNLDSPTGDTSLVLFSWVFGEAHARPVFKFFLRSVAGCGADVVLLGDPLPPDLELPMNVRSVQIGWGSLASSLERLFNGGRPLPAFRAARADKVCDVKPLTALLVPELIQGYKWWGWCDNDVWLGDVAGLLSADLRGSDTDFLSLGPSWGPLSIVRNLPATNGLAARGRNRRVALRVLSSSEYRAFDEWGEPAWGGLGFNLSFSGLLAAAAAAGELRLGRRSLGRAIWDGPCLTSNSTTCGFCSLSLRAGRTRLCAADGSELLLCHFQYGKEQPHQRLLGDAQVRMLLQEQAIASTYARGIFQFPSSCTPRTEIK